MNTQRNPRLFAAALSMVITFTLFSAVVSEAKAPLPSVSLAMITAPHAA